MLVLPILALVWFSILLWFDDWCTGFICWLDAISAAYYLQQLLYHSSCACCLVRSALLPTPWRRRLQLASTLTLDHLTSWLGCGSKQARVVFPQWQSGKAHGLTLHVIYVSVLCCIEILTWDLVNAKCEHVWNNYCNKWTMPLYLISFQSQKKLAELVTIFKPRFLFSFSNWYDKEPFSRKDSLFFTTGI